MEKDNSSASNVHVRVRRTDSLLADRLQDVIYDEQISDVLADALFGHNVEIHVSWISAELQYLHIRSNKWAIEFHSFGSWQASDDLRYGDDRDILQFPRSCDAKQFLVFECDELRA